MKLTAYLFYFLLLLFCHHQRFHRALHLLYYYYYYIYCSTFYLTCTKIPVQVIHSFVGLDNKQQVTRPPGFCGRQLVLVTDKADDAIIIHI